MSAVVRIPSGFQSPRYYRNNVSVCKHDFVTSPGGRLNKKDGLTRYGNSHVKDKTS